MIYIDPPYNTGKDFIYQDNRSQKKEEYIKNSGQFDEENNRLVQNLESNGRFHTDWLNMMYPRLKLARDLLSDDGVIFISIDDNEVNNLKKICDEIFGDSNYISTFIWKKKQGGGNDSNNIVTEHEYILCFAKFIDNVSFNLDTKYQLSDNLYPYSDSNGQYGLITLDKTSIQFSQSLVYTITDLEGNEYYPRIVKGKQSCWRWSKTKVEKEFDKLVFKNGKIYTKYYKPKGVIPKSLLIDSIYGRTESGNDDIKNLFKNKPFNYPKPLSLINHFSSISTNKNDIILDFFSGSATTAHAVMQLNAEDGGNRKFIMVQLPEKVNEKAEAFKAGYKNICEIGKERIRRAGIKIKEEAGLNADSLDTGFRVLKVDSSNMKDIYYTPDKYIMQNLDDIIDNVKKDRTAEDLLFQVALELGVMLSCDIKVDIIDDKKIFYVEDNFLIACFDKDITEKVATTIAKSNPIYAVFQNSSLANDSFAINIEQIFKRYSPNTIYKIL